MKKSKVWLYAVLVLAIYCGTLFSPIYKGGLASVASLTTENLFFYRMVILVSVLAIIVFSNKKMRGEVKLVLRDKKMFCTLAILGLLRGCELLIWAYSLKGNNTFVVNILSNTSPVFVILGSYFLFKEKTSLKALPGIAVALAGVVIVGLSGGASGSVPPLTVLMITIASLIGAIFLLFSRGLREKIGAITLMFFMFSWCLPVMGAACIISGTTMGPIPAQGWLTIVGIVIFATVMSQMVPAFVVKFIKPAHVSMMNLTGPLMSAVNAYVFLGETCGPSVLLGGGVMLVGLAYYIYMDDRAKKQQALQLAQQEQDAACMLTGE